MGEVYYCPNCGRKMKFISGVHYECKKCGAEGDEEYDEVNDEYYIDVYDDDDDDVPAGCRACGGPYPSCTTSCNLFDD